MFFPTQKLSYFMLSAKPTNNNVADYSSLKGNPFALSPLPPQEGQRSATQQQPWSWQGLSVLF